MRLVQVSRRCYAAVNGRNLLCDASSGLVASGEGLLIDTQADLAHARTMLGHFEGVLGRRPGRVVNTHEDIDHVAGNQLLEEAEIIGHRSLPARMAEVADPGRLVRLQRAAASPVGRLVLRLMHPGLLATARVMGEYDFAGIELRPPTTLFDEGLELEVGGVAVHLVHVGPAHQAGDTIVHVPGDGVVFAGDVVFAGVAPMGWAGTIDDWLRAIRAIESLEPEAVVPGHGPVCAVEELADLRAYLERVRAQARAWYDEGLPSTEAAARIDLGPHAGLKAADARVWFTVERAYRAFRGDPPDAPWDVARAFDHAWAVCRARGAAFEI